VVVTIGSRKSFDAIKTEAARMARPSRATILTSPTKLLCANSSTKFSPNMPLGRAGEWVWVYAGGVKTCGTRDEGFDQECSH